MKNQLHISKNIIKRCSDRCYQKPESFNIAKTFYPNFNQSSVLQENDFRKIFPCEDKDTRLKLMTVSFKCYTCYFKGSYISKIVCCCETTLRRKELKVENFWVFRENLVFWYFWLEFKKTYCHFRNQCPRIFQYAKFHEKIKNTYI